MWNLILMRNPRGPSQIFDYTSKLLTGVFSLWVLTTNIMLMLGKCRWGRLTPPKDGDGDVDVDGTSVWK
jgi:hypothetical protein